jgi:hypothetical protein
MDSQDNNQYNDKEKPSNLTFNHACHEEKAYEM